LRGKEKVEDSFWKFAVCQTDVRWGIEQMTN
jgi:hypothetical protein